MGTHGREFTEQESELIGLLDHPLCSLSPLVCISEGDSLLHHCFNVLDHDSAQGRTRHLLQKPRQDIKNPSSYPTPTGGSAPILPG